MNKRTCKFSLIVLMMAGCLLAFALRTALAQESKEKNITLDQARQFSEKFEPGDKITVDNRTTGRITIVGWERDFIEATASSERGAEVVDVEVNNDSSGRRIFLKADYADLGDAEVFPKPSPGRPKPFRNLDARREALKTRLQALDVRRESLKARLAAIDAAPNRAELEERRKAVASSLEELEFRRKEVVDILADLDEREPATSPTPTPTPKIEAVPSNPMEPINPANTITPPTITSPAVTWPPIQSPSSTPYSNGHPVEVNLEVKVPRNAEIELIKVIRSNVEVTGIETPLIISGDKSLIKLSKVGAVEVKTSSGEVEIENAAGLVDVVTASGAITVRNAGSDVRALSIGGDVDIQCARGRVDVSTTDGPIKLNGVGGDVDATTTNSQVRFTGAIREDGRYHLKSMSGYVEMTIQGNPPGFTAALSSYKGMVSTGFFFLLKLKQPSPPDPANASIPPPFSRRLTGRYGNGRAQLTLDSFDGVVLLNKGLPGAIKDCKQ
ncbi:MAG TPA: DUF4097 family beta strand repeat-containing protein [Pyrinomonadaceae bacterium]|nr:DUF4097 family beta strand repeat-containing protein [Pyrinomonadaceae bacterium]